MQKDKMKITPPDLEIVRNAYGAGVIKISGSWTIQHAQALETCYQKIKKLNLHNQIEWNSEDFENADTTGAWVFLEILELLKKKNIEFSQKGIPSVLSTLLSCIESYAPQKQIKAKSTRSLRELIERLGEATCEVGTLGYKLLEFLGQVIVTMFFSLLNPSRLKKVPIFVHMERIGVDSIPIISVISFLIGFVFAYQGEEQLHKFGADIYTINLVGLSIVREAGILLAAIVVAGRTGSAITAELGIMRINQEVDAMNVFGLNPMEYLVLPRILALVCVMPFLAFIADIAGLIGGGVWVVMSMDYSTHLYIKQLGTAINQWSFWIGIIKAPVFAFAIGLVSCFEGFQVSGGAESVGYHTTKSVVEGIFLVIVADALFSIFFSQLGV